MLRGRFWRLFAVLTLVVLLALSSIGSALAAPPAQAERVDVLIGFARTPGPAEQALVRGVGGRIKHSYWLVPAIAASIPPEAVAALERNPNVTVVEPDIEAHAVDFAAELNNTWGVKRIGAGTTHGDGHLGSGAKVAVLDTGIAKHADLVIVGGANFTSSDETDYTDRHGHGTHVAGTVAALRDGVGVVGAAPEASLYAVKVLGDDGSGSYSNVIAGLQWAVDNGIRVTNNSYGSSGDPGTIVKAAFDNSYAAGILHVCAAGNSGNPVGRGDNVIYPARWNSCIAVAASGSNDRRASFSSTGPAVELIAPGVDINSTYLNGAYRLASGTSMASPHAAGVAALAWAANTDLTNVQVREILQQTADDLGLPANHQGYGLVRADLAVAAVAPPGEPEPLPELTLTKTGPATAIVGEEITYTLIVENSGNVILTDLQVSDPLLWGGEAQTREELAVGAVWELTGAYIPTEAGEVVNTAIVEGQYGADVTVSDTASWTVDVRAAPETLEATAHVSYSTSGGRFNDRHLHVRVVVTDSAGQALAGASLSVQISRNGNTYANATGTTNGDGAVTFSFNNAPAGTYTTVVTRLVVDGVERTVGTEENSFTK